jgi:hypothetical protein
MLFKNPVRTSKRTPHFTVTAISWLTLFKEIIAVYSKNHTKQIIMIILDGYNNVLLIVKADGTYNYHSALKGLSVIGQVRNLLYTVFKGEPHSQCCHNAVQFVGPLFTSIYILIASMMMMMMMTYARRGARHAAGR